MRGRIVGVHDDDVLQSGLLANAGDFRLLLGGRDKDGACAGIAQDESRLFRRQSRINRNCDGSDQQTGEIGNRPLRPVFAENGDAVSLGDAPLAQRLRHSHHFLVKLLRRDGDPVDVAAVHHHHPVIAFHHGKEDVVEGL